MKKPLTSYIATRWLVGILVQAEVVVLAALVVVVATFEVVEEASCY